MKHLWDQAYERACQEVDGEPTEDRVAAIFQDLCERDLERREHAFEAALRLADGAAA